MVSHIAHEARGLQKFIDRAGKELQQWFGHHCNHDREKMVFMTAREWEGMSDYERKPFIHSKVDSESRINPYIKFLLHKKYSNKSETRGSHDESFNPKMAKERSRQWNLLPKEQREYFSNMSATETIMDHIIEKRDELHRTYEPTRLSLLEFILKTKPKRSSSSRLWFFRSECQSIASQEANKKWLNLSDEERGVYERCAMLDSKRYEFEKNAWVTKILQINIDEGDFRLSDFEIPGPRSRVESLGSFVEISRNLPALASLKKPRNPFSLFIEAFRYQIRDERPEFQFGRHLRECSEAWSKLSESERECYKEESRKLKRQRKALLASEPNAESRLTIPVDVFNTTKSIHGPCRPSHLYPKTPTLINFWAELNNIDRKHRRECWEALSPETKQLYRKKHAELRASNIEKKRDIERKHKHIKKLIAEAQKLQVLKRSMLLLGTTNKTIKNLYV